MMIDSPATILIVDDDSDHLHVMTLHLSRVGYNLVTVKSGTAAIELAPTLKPDLILLDVMMPHPDGFETCCQLKANEDTQNIPVIFMTPLSDDVVRGFEVGGVDYITKSAPMAEVKARIKTHLTLRRLQEDLRRQATELAMTNVRLQEDIIRRQQVEKSLQQTHDELVQRVDELARLNIENEQLIDKERHQRQLAEERNKELDAFAHTVAHDLKGPLGVIVGSADFLIKYATRVEPEQVVELLRTIRQSGRKGTNIIDELLLLAGIRKQDISLRPLYMVGVLNHAKQRVRVLQEEYKAEIILPENFPAAQGYAPWVEEVWVNYLSNGLKYGGRPPRLELGATPQDNGMVRFWVCDNGPGIPPEQQATLFTEFTRLDEVRAQGHGLGLSIVRRIVEKLGGRVGVESEVGQGSTFYFTLPHVK